MVHSLMYCYYVNYVVVFKVTAACVLLIIHEITIYFEAKEIIFFLLKIAHRAF